MSLSDFDFSQNIDYHYGEFPPKALDWGKLVAPLLRAQDALSRYDQVLQALPNSEYLLAPLRQQEAVISSRMEGTISTVDEVMLYEIEDDTQGRESKHRQEAIEVALYSSVLVRAQKHIEAGSPLNENLIKNCHQILLSFGRGASKTPGAYKTEQNYIGDDFSRQIFFTPIAPIDLQPAMQKWLDFIEGSEFDPLSKTAISHIEFEALHPFNDGNGRMGRMLITLLLWRYGLISQPYFYVSNYFEEHKDDYIRLMREVSAKGEWTNWVEFFLNAIARQSERNLDSANRITELYERMKPIFRDTGTKWAMTVQDKIFEMPYFTIARLARETGAPKHVVGRMIKLLHEKNQLREARPAAGRRGAVYVFEPLMKLVRVAP